jgi:hypothetical protein
MTMTQAEIREAIEWLVRDARYLARWARIHRARGQLAGTWLADRTRANALRISGRVISDFGGT